MNPRAATNDLLPFQGSPFNHLGTSALVDTHLILTRLIFSSAPGTNLSSSAVQQRREWDSNPRALADKRFSRPPRYDHFDTSPSIYLSAASVSPQRQDVFYHSFSLSSTPFSNFFYFFVFFLFSCIFHL